MVPYTREETVRLLANGLRTYAIPDEKFVKASHLNVQLKAYVPDARNALVIQK